MRQFFVPLLFGLLGGLVTFLGGLFGEVELSVLVARSLIAIVISAVICFAILFYISKSLFPEYDLFAKNGDSPKYRAPKEAKKAAAASSKSFEDPEEASLMAAAERHSESIEDSVEALEKRLNSETNSPEEQLRNADSRELANMVRHSINEEL